MRNRHDDTNGTLDRLNDALSALEGRIGIPRAQSRQHNELDAIRARQSALDSSPYGHPNAPRQPAMDNSGQLRSEIQQLRAELERGVAGNMNAGFQDIRNELRSIQQSTGPTHTVTGSGATEELRADIAHLKADVSRLAQEETLQALMERWSVVEREISMLPNTLGSREELLALSERLDHVQHTISALPQEQRFDGIENQVRTLALALEQIAEQGESARFPVDGLNSRFDEISRAIAAIPSSGETGGVTADALERIEARISSLSRILEDDNAVTASDRLDDHFAKLAGRLNMIQEETANLRTHAATAIPTEAFGRIEHQIEALASRLDQVAQPSPAPSYDAEFANLSERLSSLHQEAIALKAMNGATFPTGAIEALGERIEGLAAKLGSEQSEAGANNYDDILKDLDERLVYVIDKVNTNSNITQETAQALVSSLDTRMDEIARRIDENETKSFAVPSLESLESRLEDIAQMLGSGGDANVNPPAVSLANLEIQVEQLTQSLNGSSAPFDQDSLMSAARAAAEEAIARMSEDGSAPVSNNLQDLAVDLKELERLSRDSDTRNTRTFEAIHDTLLKIVEHLSNLEGTVSAPAPAAFMQQPEPQSQRVEVPNAPTIAPIEEPQEEPAEVPPVLDDVDFEPAVPVPPAPRPKLSPAEAAAAAAEAALKDSNAPPRQKPSDAQTAAADEPGSKSILKGMAKRLRGEAPPAVKAMTEDQDVGEVLTVTDVQIEDQDPEAALMDEPIEPGSGGADLGEIMRRVREERSGAVPVVGAPDEKVAAEGPAPAPKDDSGKSDFIAAARRAAKAAAADATVAARNEDKGKSKGMSSLGAMLTNRRKPILMGAGAILLALLSLPLLRGFILPAPDTSQVELQSQEAVVEDTSVAAIPEIEEPVEEAPVIVEDTVVEEAIVDPEPLTITEPEAAIEPVEAKASSVELNLSIDDIPQEVGPIALREAAAAGDRIALYFVGDYYSGGVPGQSGNDLKKALSWYEKSAELGYPLAQYRLANFHEKGFGTERDLNAAKKWYQMAAEQGNAAAMHNLAVLYANGVDGVADFDSATRWFQQAAEFGLKDSQFNLGILSAKGEGVAQNMSESYKWFAVAARTGDPDAAAKRDEVAKILSPEDLETAKTAAELWKAKQIDEEANLVSIPDEWIADQTATASAPTQAPQLDADQMKKAVQNIQAILNNNGYDAGPVDGVMGEKTKIAIKAFQEANGLEPTGEVNQALVAKLLELNQSNS